MLLLHIPLTWVVSYPSLLVMALNAGGTCQALARTLLTLGTSKAQQLSTYWATYLLRNIVVALACYTPHKDAAYREMRLAPVASIVDTKKPFHCSRHPNSSGEFGIKSHTAHSYQPKNVCLQKGYDIFKAIVSLVQKHHYRSICFYVSTTLFGKLGSRRKMFQRAPVTTTATTTMAPTTSMATSTSTPATGTHPTV